VSEVTTERAIRAQCLWCGHIARVMPRHDEGAGSQTFVGPACPNCRRHRWSRHVG